MKVPKRDKKVWNRTDLLHLANYEKRIHRHITIEQKDILQRETTKHL